jgi:hypothetical protein
MNEIHARSRFKDRNPKFRELRSMGPPLIKAARLITNLEKPLTRKYLSRTALSCDIGLYTIGDGRLSEIDDFFG